MALNTHDPSALGANDGAGGPSSLATLLPTVFLCLVSPIIVEVLFGSTTVSILDSLLFEIPFYGGGAVLVREIVRRRRLGWTSLLLLGVAFAIFEEFVVIQTSISPVLFTEGGSAFVYGRLFGVNWVYALWAVGYESVWAVILPIYLTELVFPRSREAVWLSGRGTAVAGLLFGLGSLGSWAIYTRVVTPGVIGHVYTPSPAVEIGATVAILSLVAAALSGRPRWFPPARWAGTPLSPGAVGGLMFVLSVLWFGLVAFASDVFPSVPPVVAIGLGIALALAATVVTGLCTGQKGWSDLHRLAVVMAGLLASMILGFWASGVAGWINVGAKAGFDGLAVIGLLVLGRKLRMPARALASPPGELSPP